MGNRGLTTGYKSILLPASFLAFFAFSSPRFASYNLKLDPIYIINFKFKFTRTQKGLTQRVWGWGKTHNGLTLGPYLLGHKRA
jgi:hypothetical protein